MSFQRAPVSQTTVNDDDAIHIIRQRRYRYEEGKVSRPKNSKPRHKDYR